MKKVQLNFCVDRLLFFILYFATKSDKGEGAIKAILNMYHTLKNKDKEVKIPKGWQFSGDSSSLTFSNSDFDVYFLIIHRTPKPTGRSLSLSAIYMDKWEVEEHHGQTGVTIKHGRKLTNKEAKEIAVKLANNLNKEQLMGKIKWIIVPVLLAALLGGLVTFIVSNYLLGD